MIARRAFVDQPVTDIEAATVVAVAAAKHWDLSEPELLRQGMNAIFRCDDVVVRVGSPTVDASCSIDLALFLSEKNISVAAPVRDDVVERGALSATAWRHVEASGDPIDWHAVGAIVRSVHDLQAADLPAAVPTPSPVAFPWWDFDRMLSEVDDHDHDHDDDDDDGARLDAGARAGIDAALERWSAWSDWEPADAVVCHGDVHPGNVIQTIDGPVLLDWDLLCAAPPGWDHAALMTWTDRWGGERGIYEAFAAGVGRSGRGDDRCEAFAELRLVAATLMRVKASYSAAAAREEANRRLAYWRGDIDAPTWRAT